MLSLCGRIVLGLVLALGLLSFSTPTAQAQAPARADRDCGDFATQAAAQSYFISRGGPRSDPDALDADGDGIACETNPCPCSTRTTGGNNNPHHVVTPPKPIKVHRDKVRVVKVIDGDTIRVRFPSGKREVVRVVGIDTPEVYGGNECGGKEASAALKSVLKPRTVVNLASDPTQADRDRYRRILRYVAWKGHDMGEAMVRAGLAKVYVYNHKPFQRTKQYRRSEKAAKRQNLGNYANCG